MILLHVFLQYIIPFAIAGEAVPACEVDHLVVCDWVTIKVVLDVFVLCVWSRWAADFVSMSGCQHSGSTASVINVVFLNCGGFWSNGDYEEGARFIWFQLVWRIVVSLWRISSLMNQGVFVINRDMSNFSIKNSSCSVSRRSQWLLSTLSGADWIFREEQSVVHWT